MTKVHPTSSLNTNTSEYMDDDALRLDEEMEDSFNHCVGCVFRIVIVLFVAIWTTCLATAGAIPHFHIAFEQLRADDATTFYALAVGMPAGFLLASCCCCCCICCCCGGFSATDEERAEAAQKRLLARLSYHISQRMSTFERKSQRYSAYALRRVSTRASAAYRTSSRGPRSSIESWRVESMRGSSFFGRGSSARYSFKSGRDSTSSNAPPPSKPQRQFSVSQSRSVAMK